MSAEPDTEADSPPAAEPSAASPGQPYEPSAARRQEAAPGPAAGSATGPSPEPGPSGGPQASDEPRASAVPGPGAGRTDSVPPRRRGLQAAAAAVVVVGAVTAAVLAAGGGHGPAGASRGDAKGASAAPADGLPHTAVEVSTGSCGAGWTRPRAGTQVFDLHNSGMSASEVYLTDPADGKFYGELDGLAPGATRPMTVDLGSGTYAFRCVPDDADAVSGPKVTVPGHLPQGPAALPVTEHDMIPTTLAYQKWVGDRLGQLAGGTAALKADIDNGDLAAARRDWLTAHLVYERMGAAYGTFGAADTAINGTAARTGGGVGDPSFSGFHRVEHGLWHGESASSLRAPAAKLDADVRALRASWPQQRMDPAALGLRAHEIVEGTAQFELTGRTDYGSGTNLATARANLDGARQILGMLRPLLAPRDPGLPQLDAALDRAQHALDAADHAGAWTPVDRLTAAQREQINAATGDLLEQLAPVAAIFDIRRTA